MGKEIFLDGIIIEGRIILDDPRARLQPQPEPTSPRIKALLSKGLIAPHTLTPDEVQEMAASVVYHLIMKKKE